MKKELVLDKLKDKLGAKVGQEKVKVSLQHKV